MNNVTKPESLAIAEHPMPVSILARAKEQKENRIPQRDRVVDVVVQAGATFWKDLDGQAYVTLPREGRVERYRLRSGAFKTVIRALYAEACPRVNDDGAQMPGSISDKAMAEALPSLEAMVYRRGTEVRTPALRSVMFENELWVDLGRDDWSLVNISPAGWQVIAAADIPLVRAEAMRPLPIPDRTKGATALQDLRRLLNLGPDQDKDFMLIVCWLLGCLWPTGPYPILAIDGEQGSGKSTLSRLLRWLVDPNKAAVRGPPRNEADLVVAASAGRVVVLDNVSFISAEMADVICRLATGAGLSKRRLFTDDEEHLIEVCRPILLNGINSVMSRGDVADRALVVTLPRIPDDARRLEAEIERDFQSAAPGILALFFDAMAEALRSHKNVPKKLPRMADFAALAYRAAPAFGWDAVAVLDAINENREAANIAVVESDPLAEALRQVLAKHGKLCDGDREWRGTPTKLLELVNETTSDSIKREKAWPKDPTRLSYRLQRLAPALLRCGIEIVRSGAGGRAGREITVKQRSECSQRSTQQNNKEAWNAGDNHSDPGADAQRSQIRPSVPQCSGNSLHSLELERWNAENANLQNESPADIAGPDEVEL